jgi:hypothetical protein
MGEGRRKWKLTGKGSPWRHSPAGGRWQSWRGHRGEERWCGACGDKARGGQWPEMAAHVEALTKEPAARRMAVPGAPRNDRIGWGQRCGTTRWGRGASSPVLLPHRWCSDGGGDEGATAIASKRSYYRAAKGSQRWQRARETKIGKWFRPKGESRFIV